MTVSRKGTIFAVYFDGTEMPPQFARVQRVEQWTGQRLGTATMAMDTTALPALRRFNAFAGLASLRELIGARCEIRRRRPDGREDVVHRGRVNAVKTNLDEGQNQIVLASRLEPHHFGRPTTGMPVFMRTATGQRGTAEIPETLVFNPVIDGAAIGNMSAHTLADGMRYFVDWRAIRTDTAQAWQEEEDDPDPHSVEDPDLEAVRPPQGVFWRLWHAVHTLCWTLNAGQEWARNPTLEEIYAAIERGASAGDEPRYVLRNVALPLGTFLPEALDRLLRPYGLTWRVRHDADKGAIELLKLGDGPRHGVHHQRRGERLDQDATNVDGFQLQLDASQRTRNRITLLGAYVRIEGTFELYRAWDNTLSTTDPAELAKVPEATDLGEPEPNLYQTQPGTYSSVWRTWVQNEAGDHNGVVQADGVALAAPYDLNAHFADLGDFKLLAAASGAVGAGGEYFFGQRVLPPERGNAAGPVAPLGGDLFLTRRRRFLRCLSQDTSLDTVAGRTGIRVEYSLDGGTTWWDVSAAEPITILDSQCGIRFEADVFGELLLALHYAGSSAKVRVTACLDADLRLCGVAEELNGGNLAEAVPELVDAGDRYQCQLLHSGSSYYSQVTTERRTILQRRDVVRIREDAGQLQRAWGRCDLGGVVRLFGADFDYSVGDVLTGVYESGPLFGLSGAAENFPSVIGIVYDADDQQTELHLDGARHENPLGV